MLTTLTARICYKTLLYSLLHFKYIQYVAVKEFWKSIEVWQSLYSQQHMGPFETWCSVKWSTVGKWLYWHNEKLLVIAGCSEKSVDLLAFETLIPKSIIQRYISLLLEHRRIILSGPNGTGKTYLTQKLADYIVSLWVWVVSVLYYLCVCVCVWVGVYVCGHWCIEVDLNYTDSQFCICLTTQTNPHMSSRNSSYTAPLIPLGVRSSQSFLTFNKRPK